MPKTGTGPSGFVGCGAYRGETLPEHGKVFTIYVLKEYHGQKIGYELMNAAFKRLSDYQNIAVWVLKGNDRAIRFYERYGFRFDGAETGLMLGSPAAELRMVCKRER